MPDGARTSIVTGRRADRSAFYREKKNPHEKANEKRK